MSGQADRHELGTRILKQLRGDDFAAPLQALRDVAPALIGFTIDFAYGDVMSRPELDLKTRQLCTVTALAGMGNARPQLIYHLKSSLSIGWQAFELMEAVLLTSVYAGFPAALNAAFAAKEVFDELELPRSARFREESSTDAESRRARGLRALEQISGTSGAAVIERLQATAPDLARFILEFSYGDVIARRGLDLRSKELATVALLTALGTAEPQLEVHIHAALNVGASASEVVEAIQQMCVYAGFPAALNGIGAARRVFEQRSVRV